MSLVIDEAADQPGAGYSIRVHALARHPGPIAKRPYEIGLCLCFACHWFVLVQLSFKASEQLFRCFAPDGAEEIDGGNLGEPLAQSSDLGTKLGCRVAACLAAQRL